MHYRKLSMLLVILAVVNACKKNDSPQDTVPTKPPADWIGFRDIVKQTDNDYTDVVSTPDKLIHISQYGTVAAYAVEPLGDGSLTLRPRKYYEHKEYGTDLEHTVGGKEGELYIIPSYWNVMPATLFRLDSNYTTLTRINANINLGVRYFQALCTDKDGGLYVGLRASDGNDGGPFYLAYSKDKGNTFNNTLIPGYEHTETSIEKIVVDMTGGIYTEMYHGEILFYDQQQKNWKVVFQKSAEESIRDFASEGDGNIYIATSNGIYRSTNYGGTVTKLQIPSEVRVPIVNSVHVSPKGTVYMSVEAYFMERADFSVSNSYYSTDKGVTWKHVTAYKGTSEMSIRGFDAAGRIMASFADTAKVPWYIDARYIHFAVTGSPAE